MAHKHHVSRMMSALTGNRQGRSPARMVGLFAESSTVFKMRAVGTEAVMVLKWALSRVHGRILLSHFLSAVVCVGVMGSLDALAVQSRGLPSSLGQQQKLYPNKAVPLINIQESPPTPEEIAAAKGMEMIFVEQMVQEMRKSVPENELIPLSNGEKIYRQMLDSEYSRMMAEGHNFGIADVVLAEIRKKK